MFCANCGVQLSDGSKFCKECGSPVENTQEQVRQEEESVSLNEEMQDTSAVNAEETVCEVSSQNETEGACAESVQTAPENVSGAPAQTITATYQQPQVQVEAPIASVPVKKTGRVKMTVLSVLMFLLIFVMSFAAITLFSLRDGLKPENAAEMAANIDVEMLLETDALGIMKEIDKDIFDKKDLMRIYEESDVDDFLQDKVKEFSEYIMGGKAPDDIKAEDIVEIVRESEDVIYDVAEYTVTESNYAKIEEFFEDEGEDAFEDLKKSGITSAVRAIMSPYLAWGFAIVTLLLFVILLIIRRGSISAFLWCAIAFIMSALALITMSIKGVTLSMIDKDREMIREAISLYLGNSITGTLLISGALLLTSIVMIVIYASVRKIQNKMQQKKNVIN